MQIKALIETLKTFDPEKEVRLVYLDSKRCCNVDVVDFVYGDNGNVLLGALEFEVNRKRMVVHESN